MDALKVALLVVLAITGSTWGAVLKSQDEFDSPAGATREKRSPRKAPPKKPASKSQPAQTQDFKADCMTPALELVQSCCPVPLLIPKESQRRCNDGEKRLKPGLFHTIRESYIQPLRTGKKRIPNQKDFNMAAQHFVGGPMCFIECAMKDKKWVGDDGRIDANVIENEVLTNLRRRTYNMPWVDVAKEAIQTCVQETESPPMQTIQNAMGKQCNTKPAVYMNCVRKKLIMKCPADKFSESYGCKKAREQLEKCSPLDVLKHISSGGPPPDMNSVGQGQDGMGMGGGNMGGGMDGGEMPQGEMPPQEQPPMEQPPMEQPQEQPPPPEEAPPPEPAAEEPPPEPAAEAPPAEEPQAAAEEAPPAEEPQPAAEEAQPAAEEPAPEEPPAEEPPAEE